MAELAVRGARAAVVSVVLERVPVTRELVDSSPEDFQCQVVWQRENEPKRDGSTAVAVVAQHPLAESDTLPEAYIRCRKVVALVVGEKHPFEHQGGEFLGSGPSRRGGSD